MSEGTVRASVGPVASPGIIVGRGNATDIRCAFLAPYMQRRAAAALFAFFLVMGASAYSIVALAESPEIRLDSSETVTDQPLRQGDTFTVDGQQYNVSELGMSEASGGGGHGGGGGEAHPTGTIAWAVEGADANETLENGSTIEYNNASYLVTVGAAPSPEDATPQSGTQDNESGAQGNQSGNQSGEVGTNETGNQSAAGGNESATGTSNETAGDNSTEGQSGQSGNESGAQGNQSGNESDGQSSSDLESAPGQLVLTEQQDVQSILESDSAVYNQTVESGGETFVRYKDNGSFVRLSEYLSTPDQQRFQEGDRLNYSGRTVQVGNVSNDTATLVWTEDSQQEASLEQGGNVTLANGETYVVNFITEESGNETNVSLQLSQNYEEYQRQNEIQHSFQERMNGFWGIIIISSIAALLVISMAFMPVRG